MDKKNKLNKKDEPNSSINRRLDVLIRVVLETLYNKNDKKFGEGDGIRLLNSAGLTPTEISTLLGKGGDPTTVSYALYSKPKKKKSSRTEDNKDE